MILSPANLFALVVLFVWAILYLRGVYEARRTSALPPKLDASRLSVVAYVPARNEAEVIEPSVRALLAEPLAQVVVIDDGSTDATAAVLASLADPRLVMLTGKGPRAGECGKPAALREAVKASPADTDWLLFVDADVVLERGAVAALVFEAQRAQADLISLYPQLVIGSFIEALVMPTIGALILRRYAPAKVGDPNSRVAFANGQVILVKRETYERVGGHDAVVTQILEDVRFAELVKAKGGRLALVDGRALAKTRMYAGWAELQEGWAKNIHLLLGSSLAATLLWAILLPLLATAPLLSAFTGEIGIATYLAVLGMQADLRRRAGASPWYAPLAPLGAVLASWILLKSAWLVASKRAIPWKGRTYS